MSATLMNVRSSGVQGKQDESARMHGCILVADASSDDRRTMSSILDSMGFEVAIAENGRDAFKTALSAWQGGQPFDLVLMDTQMPDIDGYEATALLRSVNYEGPIVALAPCRFNRAHDKCVMAGCDGCTSKPISYRMLREAIERHLPHEHALVAWGGHCSFAPASSLLPPQLLARFGGRGQIRVTRQGRGFG